MHYEDINNNLHFLDDASFIHLLPSDCVEITDEEAESIRVSQLPVIDPQIAINQEALAYLASTGWVVEKMSEYSLLGIDTAQYLSKYADILTKRQEARNKIVY